MTLLAAVGMAREAEIVAGPGVRVAVGGGRGDVLAKALEGNFDSTITAVISVGIGGGLASDLAVGEVVIATDVLSLGGHWQTSKAWTANLSAALPKARLAAVCGSDAMVIHAWDKASLRDITHADLVDMESHIAARFALERDLNFAVLRVVSDVSQEGLPFAVLDGLKPDGRPNLAGVLKGLARRPGDLPGLIRLGRNSEIALKALAAAWSQAGPALTPSPAR